MSARQAAGQTTQAIDLASEALEDAYALADSSCSEIVALVRDAKSQLSSTLSSTSDAPRSLDLIVEKSQYLRDSIDGLRVSSGSVNTDTISESHSLSPEDRVPLAPVDLLRRLDDWLSASKYGEDHPWRLCIAATLEDDRAGTEAAPIGAYVDAEEFDQHLDALRDIRVLAEAASAWLDVHKGCEIDRGECASLLELIATRCKSASGELQETIKYLVLLAASNRRGAK